MQRSSRFQPGWIVVSIGVTLLLSCAALAQNYVAPGTPMVGSPNTITANAPVPRPTTHALHRDFILELRFRRLQSPALQLHAAGKLSRAVGRGGL